MWTWAPLSLPGVPDGGEKMRTLVWAGILHPVHTWVQRGQTGQLWGGKVKSHPRSRALCGAQGVCRVTPARGMGGGSTAGGPVPYPNVLRMLTLPGGFLCC